MNDVYSGMLERGITTLHMQDIADEVNVYADNTDGWHVFSKIPAKV